MAEPTTTTEDPPVPDGEGGLDDDAGARQLGALIDFLQGEGVELDDPETVEARLAADPAQESAAPTPEVPARRPGRRTSRQREAHEAAAFEDLGESLQAEGVEVMVSEDGLTAAIPRITPETTLKEVATALKREKVRHGVLVDAIKAAIARAHHGEELHDTTVARGSAPQPSSDAHFEWAVDVGGRAGTVLEDGSIDLRDRRLITVVTDGDLLGRLLPAEPGTNGKDVHGKVLEAPPPAQLEVVPGAQVRLEQETEGRVAAYAEGEGGVTYEEQAQSRRRRKLRVSLTAMSRIDGDVDYATGHIDFHGDVVIDGSVKALFGVKATGSVTIGGNVEAGAWIEAGGDILISGGVVGDTTKLVAANNVMAKFIQQATVRVGGNLEVGCYAFEASVRCRGEVVLAGMGEGSGRALVGGLMWAGRKIETPSLGSPSNPRIRVVVGVDPHLVMRSEKLRKQVRALEQKEREILESLGVERFDPRRIKQALGAAPAAARKAMMESVRTLTQIGEAHHRGREELQEIARSQQELAQAATLTVTGLVSPGVELRMGEYQLKITEDAQGVRFRLLEEDGETAIRMQEAPR